MKLATLTIAVLAAASLAAPAAEAASKRKKTQVRHATVVQRGEAPARGGQFQGGVMKGPLYNGQDYLGDDPDPNIRAGLLKDQNRYQGSY